MLPTNEFNILKEIGLDENEAAIYYYLLKRGGDYPSNIAKATKINRSTVYKTLMRVEIKGLVSQVELGKKQYYQAEPPHKLRSQANYQLNEAKNNIEKLEEILPALRDLFRSSNYHPMVKHFSGKAGVEHVYRSHYEVNIKYEMRSWSNVETALEFTSPKFLQHYANEKLRLGITTRAILPEPGEESIYPDVMYKSRHKKVWPKIKYLSADKFPFDAEITLYGTDRISFLNLQEENASATIIQDKVMHDVLGIAFELSWQALDDK